MAVSRSCSQTQDGFAGTELENTTHPNGMRLQLGSLRTVQAATPYRTACLDLGGVLIPLSGTGRQR